MSLWKVESEDSVSMIWKPVRLANLVACASQFLLPAFFDLYLRDLSACCVVSFFCCFESFF